MGNSATSEQAIRELCRENRSTAEKIRDFLKRLVTHFTGSEEEKQLRKALDLFEQALQESKENGKEKFSFDLNDEYGVQKNEYRFVQSELMQKVNHDGNIKDGIYNITNMTKTFVVEADREIAKITDVIDQPNDLSRLYEEGYYKSNGNSENIDGSSRDIDHALEKRRSEQGRHGDDYVRSGNSRNARGNDESNTGYLGQEENSSGQREPVSHDVEHSEERERKGKIITRFSLSDPVEETRDLVAVHNSSVEALEESMKLGGLPSPSIAIVKAIMGHIKYGVISLVFDKSSIDPQANKANKVYGSDAWTPTAPRVDYQVNRDAASAFEAKPRPGSLDGNFLKAGECGS